MGHDSTGPIAYRFGRFTLDLARGFLLEDGQPVMLRPKAFEVLRQLVINHGSLVSKDELVAKVWAGTAVTDNSLAQCLVEVRRALADDTQSIVRTVARRGYVFEAPVTTFESLARPDVVASTEHVRGDDRILAEELGEPQPDATTSATGTVVTRERSAPNRRPRWMLATLGLAAAAALVFATVRRDATPPPDADEPPLQLTNFNDTALFPSLSHDGRMLAFVRGGFFGAVAGVRGQVYVKLLPDGDPVQLTDDPTPKAMPVFSPDDSRIIYTTMQPGLSWDSWQVPVLRGTPQPFMRNASGLVWLDKRQLLYSTITSGIHMGVARSAESQADFDKVYFPARLDGMAHRSAPSPDGKQLLVVEMVGGTWTPCRLVPLDGTSAGRRVGPLDGQCTQAAWSPDGQWMYFTSNIGGSFHIWRQRLAGGEPEQITFGPTDQDGLAPTPDGRYLITSMGLTQASFSLHASGGDRQLTTERYVSQPAIDPTGKTFYYIVRVSASHGPTSGELWALDLESGVRHAVLPGMAITSYSIAPDGQQLVFTTVEAPGGDGVWVAALPRRDPPRRVASGSDIRAFFASNDEFVYTADDSRLYRMRTDGTGRAPVTEGLVSYLSTVSPDGRWAVVIRPADGQRAFTKMEFVSLRGEASFEVCNVDCSAGPRSFLTSQPFVWSHDASRLIVNLSYFGQSTQRSVSMPYRADAPPAVMWPSGLRFEKDVLAAPGATVINAVDTAPGPTPDSYVSRRASMLSNLYRVRLPQTR